MKSCWLNSHKGKVRANWKLSASDSGLINFYTILFFAIKSKLTYGDLIKFSR